MSKKADFYAQQFMTTYKENCQDGNDERSAFVNTIIFICQCLIEEVQEIGKTRKCHCNSAWDAVVKEQDQKWRAVVRKLDCDALQWIPSSDSFQKVWAHFRGKK